jgi:hypothetical protein
MNQIEGRRADHDTKRIGGDEVTGLRNRDLQTTGDIGQDAHHDEFGHANAEAAKGEGK